MSNPRPSNILAQGNTDNVGIRVADNVPDDEAELSAGLVYD
jgi:hypothetical protein